MKNKNKRTLLGGETTDSKGVDILNKLPSLDKLPSLLKEAANSAQHAPEGRDYQLPPYKLSPLPVSRPPAVGDEKPASKDPSPATDASTATNTSNANNNGLSKMFNILYFIIFAVGILLLLAYLIITIMGLVSYSKNEKLQRNIIKADPNLYYKDTAEYKALHYNTNKIQGEPYQIYTGQQIVSIMYIIFGAFIIVFSLNIAIFMSHNISGKNNTDKFDINPIYLSGILLIFVYALVLRQIYKGEFLKKIQNNLQSTDEKLRDLTSTLYQSMTLNDDFLNALKTGNEANQYDLMKNESSINEVFRMLYTKSLYDYFDSVTNKNDENYNEIAKIFTSSQIRSKTIDPVKYLYYNQNLNISNVYNRIQNELDLTAIKNANGKKNMAKEASLINMLDSTLFTINNRNVLQKLPNDKKQIYTYLITMLAVTIIFIVLLIAISYVSYKFK